MLRGFGAGLLGLVFAVAVAAEERPNPDGVRTVQPQAVFSIEHVAGTGDIVQLVFREAIYDDASVRASLASLAKMTGGDIQNYQYVVPLTPEEPTKVFFIAKNLLDPAAGDIRLQPLVRAFMSGKEGARVESFSVRIVGQRPSPYSTLASYSSKSVALKAFYDAATPSIEYRILVLAQTPGELEIPPRHIPDQVTQPVEKAGSARAPTLLLLVLTAGASAGALVYFSLLGKRS